MRDTAVEVGRAVCDGALRLGFSSLRCYEDAFLISLAWMAGALLLAAAVMAGKGLRSR
jgi:hypothetical protein